MSSVAQCVLDPVEHPVAAIAVTYVAAATEPAEVQQLVAAVERAAVQLSRRLRGLG